MKKISGFTFVHNALDSGYPIFEAIQAVYDYVDELVIINMESTDGTLELMSDKFWTNNYSKIRLRDGKWGNQAGETLKQAHSLYKECSGDIIFHFEADEVYSKSLLDAIIEMIQFGAENLEVYRIQLEQNFQRCRWYPEPVHRVWPKNADIEKNGHTTNIQGARKVMPAECGFLWDITNCFRDNWIERIRKQAELRDEDENYIMVPIHTLQESRLKTSYINDKLRQPHWEWKSTPFDIPDVLKPLVGMVRYEPTV